MFTVDVAPVTMEYAEMFVVASLPNVALPGAGPKLLTALLNSEVPVNIFPALRSATVSVAAGKVIV
jgi:hypothetical protein